MSEKILTLVLWNNSVGKMMCNCLSIHSKMCNCLSIHSKKNHHKY